VTKKTTTGGAGVGPNKKRSMRLRIANQTISDKEPGPPGNAASLSGQKVHKSRDGEPEPDRGSKRSLPVLRGGPGSKWDHSARRATAAAGRKRRTVPAPHRSEDLGRVPGPENAHMAHEVFRNKKR